MEDFERLNNRESNILKDKKIAIITYHRSNNYGSVLQAYALSKYLNTQGARLNVIDYHSEKQDKLYKTFESVKGLMSVARNIQTFFYLKSIKLRKKKFDEFLKNNFSLTKEYVNVSDISAENDNYDLFICGSDQIWNTSCDDFSKAYTLDFVKDKSKCVSYAASIGKKFIKPEDEDFFYAQLKDFYKLSLREKDGVDEIKRITGRGDVSMVSDPVTLLDKNDWNELIKDVKALNKKYILAYFIGDVPFMRDFVKRLAKIKRLPIIVINKNLRDMLYRNKKRYGTGPKEFLALIKNAEYVVSDSFHATVFSIIFKKQFFTFAKTDQESAISRLNNFLSVLGLKNRLNASDVNLQNIDYDNKTIEEAFNEYSKTGKEFLSELT